MNNIFNYGLLLILLRITLRFKFNLHFNFIIVSFIIKFASLISINSDQELPNQFFSLLSILLGLFFKNKFILFD